MTLSCLVFSRSEESVQPIWPLFADLGIDAEICASAVDAVEKLSSQRFQIVIIDWSDQPEAAVLLKGARDQRASQRPLTLAIVSDDSRVPEALRAGANSVLLLPFRVDQVRDTIKTACELVRSKASPATQAMTIPPSPPLLQKSEGAEEYTPPQIPRKQDTRTAGKDFRAGEFLQATGSAPSAQFDTESEIQKSLDHAASILMDSVSELEPIAAGVGVNAVKAVEPPPPPAALPSAPQAALSGWASLQARLTKPVLAATPPRSSSAPLLSYAETPSAGVKAAEAQIANKPLGPGQPETHRAPGAQSEAEETETLDKAEDQPAVKPAVRIGIVPLAAVAAIFIALVAVPQTRQKMQAAAAIWLNPSPAPLPLTVTQHDSFRQSGDEYKLPVAENIPDATTDPSQIQIVPVIDPTAKKHLMADGEAAQIADKDNSVGDPTPKVEAGAAEDHSDLPTISGSQKVENAVSQPMLQPLQNTGAPLNSVTERSRVTPTLRTATLSQGSGAGHESSIPSSMKSQIASMTPEASGAKVPEAAMSSIEPVVLPETAAWTLLAQKVDPEYPAAAKASGQKGGVILQVLIARDGTVQDAKFMQGSLIFAKAAIEAVRQWRFKPYVMNGRTVSVQSSITLNFNPGN